MGKIEMSKYALIFWDDDVDVSPQLYSIQKTYGDVLEVARRFIRWQCLGNIASYFEEEEWDFSKWLTWNPKIKPQDEHDGEDYAECETPKEAMRNAVFLGNEAWYNQTGKKKIFKSFHEFVAKMSDHVVERLRENPSQVHEFEFEGDKVYFKISDESECQTSYTKKIDKMF